MDVLPDSAYGRCPRTEPLRPGYGSLVEAFTAQAAQHPDRPAVLADDGPLSYRQLAAAAAGTGAAIVAAAGPVRGATAAILCGHGPGTVVAILAALSAGRAYVPLDPSYPAARLAEILADCAADVIVTDAGHAALAGRLNAGGASIVHIGQTGDPDAPPVPVEPDDAAYLLYTSGSTGVPKGVVQSHRNVLFAVTNHIARFGLTPADRTSVATSFGFDMAVTDTWSALLSGAAAVPVDVRTVGVAGLGAALDRHGVTVYHSTPTVFRHLAAGLSERLPRVRTVLLGGEEVTRHDVVLARRHFSRDVVFVNGYGATEISFAAQNHLPAGASMDDAVVPVGWPLPGIDVELVDGAGRPTCLAGQLVVRSPYVATGYWRRPELTAERFENAGAERRYRTGDLARRRPDGALVYLGRADRLVKIRGNRVELGEVEARLAAEAGVGQAAVVARTDPRGDKEIIGYVVAARAERPAPHRLRAALAAALPEFMVPRAIVVVEALPVGATGKLDVAALPPPPAPVVSQRPVGAWETLVAAAWCEALGLDEVDRGVRFGDLGGQSLQLGIVARHLTRELGRPVALTTLLEHPTVAELAAHLADPGGSRQLSMVDTVADRMRRRREARR